MQTIAHRSGPCRDPRCPCPSHRRAARLPRSPAEREFEFEFEFEVSRSSSEYIRWVQRSLNQVGGAALAEDGISGTLTKAAVKAFQSRSALEPDGVVGPLTEAALLRAGAAPPPGSNLAPAPRPAPAPVPLPMARLAVSEDEILALLPAFLPYRYGTPVRYPHPLPGNLRLETGSAQLINCCCFTEGALVPAWAARHGSALRWDSTRHMDMMVRDDGVDIFSPITAMVATGMGSALAAGQPPTAWCLAQGWRSFPSGHQFIIVARHAPTDRVLTLEANNSATGLDGVGCRGFGALRNLPGNRPPARWWEDTRAPTWSRLQSDYPGGLRLAQLAVTGARWAGV